MTDHWTENSRREYRCRRTSRPIDLSAAVADAVWDELPWTDHFTDITGLAELTPRFKTRVRMGWNERFIYIQAELEEPHVWGTIEDDNEVMFMDNNFEVFVDPDCDGLNYYELEINALGSIWELNLPKPYGDGGKPRLGCNIAGLQRRIRIDGTLNDASDKDQGWRVEIAIPWTGLSEYHSGDRCPPNAGDRWRFNFSRVEWRHEIVDGRYVRIPPHGTPLAESLNPEEQEHPEDNWVWSPQGVVNMHMPERWGDVIFEG